MRHIVVGATVVLLLAAGVSGAAADSGSDTAFVEWLARQATTTHPEAPGGVGIPEPVLMACSVSRDCGDGNTAACTGTYSCKYSYGGVSCDGREYACPNFCEALYYCCGTYLGCSSLRGDCQVISGGVSCNGHTSYCEPCGPPPPI